MPKGAPKSIKNRCLGPLGAQEATRPPFGSNLERFGEAFGRPGQAKVSVSLDTVSIFKKPATVWSMLREIAYFRKNDTVSNEMLTFACQGGAKGVLNQACWEPFGVKSE